MKSRHRKNLIVGIFVTIGLTIFIVTIYLVGKKENIFGSPVKVSAIFEDVQGLREGDKVRLSGIDIGNVSSLSFMQDNHVFVQMNLDAELVKFVMKDSRVTIGSEGLMGSKVVMIIPGSMTSQPVNEFDTLVTVEQVSIDDILIEVNKSSENIAIVSSELISITQKINRGDGVFGKIFTDTTFTANMDDASDNIARITTNLNELGSAGQNMDEIANNIREITEKINQGEGIFGRMFTDTALTNNLFLTSKNLQETSNSLSTLAAKLSNDSSALNMFINDPSFADSLSGCSRRRKSRGPTKNNQQNPNSPRKTKNKF